MSLSHYGWPPIVIVAAAGHSHPNFICMQTTISTDFKLVKRFEIDHLQTADGSRERDYRARSRSQPRSEMALERCRAAQIRREMKELDRPRVLWRLGIAHRPDRSRLAHRRQFDHCCGKRQARLICMQMI
jgi:hypothetical protein